MTDQTGEVKYPAAEGNQGTPDTQDQAKDVTVPLEVVTKLRDELKTTKGSLEQVTQELNLFKANAQFQPQQQQQAPAAEEPNDDADPFGDLDDDEVLNAGEVRKALKALRGKQATGQPKADAATAQKIAELELRLEDPDYQDTIKNYLPEMINSNPAIKQSLMALTHDPVAAMKAAHAFAKMSPKYQQKIAGDAAEGGETPPDPLAQLDQILKNAGKPGSPAQVGGSSAVHSSDRYAAMNDDEFAAHVQKVISGSA